MMPIQSNTDLQTVIGKFIVDNYLYRVDAKTLSENDSFLEHDIIDSTGILEFILFLEETFAIQIADAEVVPENLDSIERAAAFVRRKLNSRVDGDGGVDAG